jgi:hypothetical protein
MRSVSTHFEESLLFSTPYDLDLPVIMDDELLWRELLVEQQVEHLFDVYLYPESGELVQVRQLA